MYDDVTQALFAGLEMEWGKLLTLVEDAADASLFHLGKVCVCVYVCMCVCVFVLGVHVYLMCMPYMYTGASAEASLV